MTLHRSVRWAFLPAVAATVLACADGTSPIPQPDVFLSISVLGAESTVVGLAAEVTGPGIDTAIQANLVKNGSLWEGTLKVPAGSDRTFTVRAFDAKGIETHRGQETADILEGSNTIIAMTLEPLVGDSPIEATLGTYTVTVSPAADTVAVADTTRFSAEVTDVNGTVVSGPELAWASANPGLATVDSTGLATGKYAGDTEIVANYKGFAGNALLTVQ